MKMRSEGREVAFHDGIDGTYSLKTINTMFYLIFTKI